MRFFGSLIVLGTTPELPRVRTEAVGELINTTDFTTIDVTEWAVFLDQPPEVFVRWDATNKYRMFSLLGSEIPRLYAVILIFLYSAIVVIKRPLTRGPSFGNDGNFKVVITLPEGSHFDAPDRASTPSNDYPLQNASPSNAIGDSCLPQGP
ncbi:hypothetical protein J3E72DRAFT_270407 [Bipolaris maydis]|nr:hypothetical protein J3E72DRAFT_270407 [Bipolaris maydis]